MKIYEILGENFAGAFAGVPMSLGAGDPAASIYYKPKKKKKSKKTEMGYSSDVGNLAYNTPVKTKMIKR
jgi:hypothetical protein